MVLSLLVLNWQNNHLTLILIAQGPQHYVTYSGAALNTFFCTKCDTYSSKDGVSPNFFPLYQEV